MGNFYNIFKSLRVASGYTQLELSQKLGISRSAIGMYERGSRMPDHDTMELIADFFNVDLDYLYGRSSKTTFLPGQQLTAAENSMLDKYRALNPYDRGRVDQLIEDLLGKNESSGETKIS